MAKKKTVTGGRGNSGRSGAGNKSGRRAGKPVELMASAEEPKRSSFPPRGMQIADFYRPLKKPVTLRLDADVIAWFKKDGKRYQTRINIALRKVMEREIKNR